MKRLISWSLFAALIFGVLPAPASAGVNIERQGAERAGQEQPTTSDQSADSHDSPPEMETARARPPRSLRISRVHS